MHNLFTLLKRLCKCLQRQSKLQNWGSSMEKPQISFFPLLYDAWGEEKNFGIKAGKSDFEYRVSCEWWQWTNHKAAWPSVSHAQQGGLDL